MGDWISTKLENVCHVITDGSHFSPKTTETGFPMASVKDMNDYGLNLVTSRRISEEDYNLLVSNGCQPSVNDVLIAKDGNSMLETVCVIKSNLKCVLLSSIAILRPNTNVVYPEFLLYYLRDKSTKQLMLNGYRSGSAIPRMVLKDFKMFPINLPPLPTQRKIAAILSALDDKIENNRKTCAKLEEIAAAVFKRWFVDFEFPDAQGRSYKSSGGKMVESELGLIPEGWGIYSIGDLLSSASVKHKFNKEALVFLNTGDIYNGDILHHEYMNVNIMPGQAKKSVQKGDILYSEIRPINRRFAFIDFDAEEYVVSTKLMVLRCKKNNYESIIYYFLTSDNVVVLLQTLAESRSGTFPQIRFETIRPIKIALPKETKKINDYFSTMISKVKKSKRESEMLKQIRDTLLPKLISGELSVEEVEE